MKKVFLVLTAFSIGLLFCACGGESNEGKVEPEAKSEPIIDSEKNKGQAFIPSDGFDKNVLEVAIENEDFSTLVAAVQAAGVENALVNAGPLTVFAPNNAAFAKLPEGTVETLLEPENKSKLAFILTNHVAPANYPVKTLTKTASKGQKLYMASGEYVDVSVDGEDIIVGGTKILGSVKVSNGWIHIVEDCILPAE